MNMGVEPPGDDPSLPGNRGLSVLSDSVEPRPHTNMPAPLPPILRPRNAHSDESMFLWDGQEDDEDQMDDDDDVIMEDSRPATNSRPAFSPDNPMRSVEQWVNNDTNNDSSHEPANNHDSEDLPEDDAEIKIEPVTFKTEDDDGPSFEDMIRSVFGDDD